MKNKLITGLFLTFTACALGQNITGGFTVPEDTLSPDGHYGVRVPVFDPDQLDKRGEKVAKSNLIGMDDGRVLTELLGQTGFDRSVGHLVTRPSRWSANGSFLLWMVDGKWSPQTLDLLKISAGEVEWQTNLLQVVQHAALTLTKKVAPRKYAVARKANAIMADGYHGERSDYPEGFTIDMKVVGSMEFPLQVEAVLTSDPKYYRDEGRLPDSSLATLDSYLEGSVNAQGRFAVTSFHLGRRTWDRF